MNTAASAPTRLSPDPAWSALHAACSAPYRRHGTFAWHFARGKLGRDPVFRHLLSRGLLNPPRNPGHLRIVDLGCGQGLLASLVHHALQAQHDSRWPLEWPALPEGFDYLGIELMQRDVDRATESLQALQVPARFVCADMRHEAITPTDIVVILDVLHYVDHAAQADILSRVRQALGPGGRLLLRVGDMSQASGFAASQWVDRIVTMIRGHRVPPTFGRPLADWVDALNRLGFRTDCQPMSQGTPFANVLIVADLPMA